VCVFYYEKQIPQESLAHTHYTRQNSPPETFILHFFLILASIANFSIVGRCFQPHFPLPSQGNWKFMQKLSQYVIFFVRGNECPTKFVLCVWTWLFSFLLLYARCGSISKWIVNVKHAMGRVLFCSALVGTIMHIYGFLRYPREHISQGYSNVCKTVLNVRMQIKIK